MVQYYANCIHVVIDGTLQMQECAVSISHRVNEPVRVEMTSLVPLAGLEFDARAEAEMPAAKRPRHRVQALIATAGAVPAASAHEPFLVSDRMIVAGYELRSAKAGGSAVESVVLFEDAPEEAST